MTQLSLPPNIDPNVLGYTCNEPRAFAAEVGMRLPRCRSAIEDFTPFWLMIASVSVADGKRGTSLRR